MIDINKQKYIESKAILDKMTKVIDTSNKNHKEMFIRYIGLCNKMLHYNIDNYDLGVADIFGIAGASMALEKRYEGRLRTFATE